MFGKYIVPSQIATDFSKAIMQRVFQNYLGENIAQYLWQMFKITKGIIPSEEDQTTRFDVCSFYFLKLHKDFIDKIMMRERPIEVTFNFVFASWGDLTVVTTLSKP